MTVETKSDRFGNKWAAGVPYARGAILSSTEDDFKKMQVAWSHIRRRGAEQTSNFSGLEHGLPLEPAEIPIASDFLTPALYFDEFQTAALSHLGGDSDQHEAALCNRITGATLATHLALAMLLLRDAGVISVHFVGRPPGTSALMFNSSHLKHSRSSVAQSATRSHSQRRRTQCRNVISLCATAVW